MALGRGGHALRAFGSVIIGCALFLAACSDAPVEQTRLPVESSARATQALAAPGDATWSPLIPLSLVPASGANLPNGKVLLWASNSPVSFGGGGQTYTTLFDPTTQTAADALVNQTGHDMFCTGTTNLADGTVLINGGDDSGKTSLYNPITNTWSTGGTMNITRGYEANTLLQNGSVLTYGGSWSGGQGNKHAEVWSPATGWQRLSGVPIDPALDADPRGVYRQDNHMWLFAAPNGQVLHAGPSKNMNWIDTNGAGSTVPAGVRGDDVDAMCGDAVMYDIGKVLKAGGASAYENVLATTSSYVLDIGTSVSVRRVASMSYARTFANGVALPNGQVVIIGGQAVGKPFSDDLSVLRPELWDPATETFTLLPAMAVGRNYHSIALLLPDGRVISAGSGLCGAGCAGNHANLQILTPHYLLNADGTPATRPVITSAPTTVTYGTTADVTTDSPIAQFSLMRLSSTTHTVNNDQRRVPVSFISTGTNTWRLNIPSNPGVLLPGYYMLFALNAAGTPSIASTVLVSASGAPVLVNPGTPTVTVGLSVQVSLAPLLPQPGVTFDAVGLPPGLTLNPTTGAVTGTPTLPGRYVSSISATSATASNSSLMTWNVAAPLTASRFVSFEMLGVTAGNAAAIAELTLIDGAGNPIPRTAWSVSADSSEAVALNGAAINAIDGDPNTVWQSDTTTTNLAPPHSFTITLDAPRYIGGFTYLPPATGTGTVTTWRLRTSPDNLAWDIAAEGSFTDFADAAALKTIYLKNVARAHTATQSSQYTTRGPQTAVDGTVSGNGEALVTHTLSEANAWWQVDLGSLQAINAIRVWNRTDCCSTRLTNFAVMVSTTDMTGRTYADLIADPAIFKSQVPGTIVQQLLIDAKTQGRYVRVQLAGTNFLSLAEVEVFGRVPGNRAPIVAAVSNPTGDIHALSSLALSATDPDGDPVSYAATGLPPGLTLSATTGQISGTPSIAGHYSVVATAADSFGGVGSTSFEWTVTAPPITIGQITAEPAASGSTVTWSVTSDGDSGTTYTWDFGDGTMPTTASSAANISHTYAAPGIYEVTVTAIGANGAVGVHQFLQAIYPPVPHGAAATRSSNVVYEQPAGANPRVWLVNQDNDSVSVFDAVLRSRLAEIEVGFSPRHIAIAPDGRAWVTNKSSASISVISPGVWQVLQTIALPRGSRPHGLVFSPDGLSAYVTLEATGQLIKLDPATGAVLGAIDVGPTPRQLAVTANSATVLVSRFITPPLPGEGTAVVQTTLAGFQRGGEVIAVDAASFTMNQVVVLQHSDKADSTVQGRGIPNSLAAPVISPDGTTAWVPSKQDNIKRGLLRDGLNLDFQNTVRAVASRINLTTMSEDYAARVDFDNSSLASAGVFHPTGAYLFVALPTSRFIAVVDPISAQELFRVDAGRAPDGLAISTDGRQLFVSNFMDRTVGIYDLSPLISFGSWQMPLLATLSAVTTDKLPPAVLAGKQLFYDARDTRLARDSYMSCATCHDEGGTDGRTWDFTGLGEGLRNTISLKGKGAGHGPLHWSANFDEGQDFEGQIRSFAGGTGLMSDALYFAGTRSQPLGDVKAGQSADLDALAAYLASLNTFEPSPWRTPTGALTADALAGRPVFAAKCAVCHAGAAMTDSEPNALQNVGTLKASSGLRLGATLPGLDTPTLRDAFATAPYLHDGSAATLADAITAHTTVSVTPTELTQLAAFVRQAGADETEVASTAQGLRARYFANETLSGNLAVQRVEAVDFALAATGPGAGLPVDHFSARWAGRITAPVSGKYQVETISDDGVRVWVNGVLVINNWAAHSPATNAAASMNWVAGQKYGVVIEYFDRVGQSQMQLKWKVPGATAYVSIPAASLDPTVATAQRNLAVGRPATQSSTYAGRLSVRAVDGNRSGAADTLIAQTNSTLNPWWQVDLGRSASIDSIRLWNRTNCCAERLANFTVYVSETDLTGRTFAQIQADATVKRYVVIDKFGTDLTLPVATKGRYVRVQLNGTNYLTLAEVEVNGQ